MIVITTMKNIKRGKIFPQHFFFMAFMLFMVENLYWVTGEV